MLEHSSRPSYAADARLQDSARPVLAIVGAGRVGCALATALTAQGYAINAVFSRSAQSASRLAEQVNARMADLLSDAAHTADLIVLSVPDAAIRAVCESLAANADLRGRAVIYVSGVTPVHALMATQARGAQIGGLHPFLPVANCAAGFAPGTAFGLEAEHAPLHGWLASLVDALGGVALWLPPGTDRARYHAAAVLLSNYMVTLFAESEALLAGIGLDASVGRAALIQLARTTLDNLQQVGPVAALTGPIARGDAHTVRAHLDALNTLNDPQLSKIYRLLGQRTARIAAARGLPAAQLALLDEVLNDHADNDPGLSEDEAQRTAHPDGDGL